MSRSILAAIALGTALFLGGVRAEEKQQVVVFAAASLTESFNEIGKEFEAAHPNVTMSFSYGASNQLRTQLEHGAKADVFASANTKEMTSAVAAKVIDADTVKTFARNRLVVIFPKENPAKIAALADLAKAKLKFVTADAAVPVGKYTLDMLDKMATDDTYGARYKDTVIANIVSKEDSVKGVVAKVRLGAADAGVVYVSDVTPAAVKELGTLEIPDKFNQIASYPIAPLLKAPQEKLAKEFVEYVLSDKGQAVLAKYNFLSAKADEKK